MSKPKHRATHRTGAGVTVRTFGRFAIDCDGAAMPLGVRARRKPLEVLKTLIALGGSDVPTHRLADALWPEADGDAAQRALFNNLHRLRGLIGTDALHLEHGRLSVSPETCRVDALELPGRWRESREALDAGRDGAAWAAAGRAMELYAGPFLDGDTEPAEVLAARERLHTLHLHHIQRMGQAWSGLGRHERAAVLYERGLELDDAAELVYQRLMRCYQACGRPEDALGVYQRCRDALAQRLGGAPSQQTERLREQLAASQLEPPPPREAPAAAIYHERIGPRRSIALVVQPWANLDGDASVQPFCEGIREDLIAELSKISALSVQSRAAAAGGGPSSGAQRAPDGVAISQFVLTGSVRRSGDRVRVNAALENVRDGRRVWGERYERTLWDIFQVQDEIVQQIVTAMDVELLEGEQAYLWRKTSSNREAYVHHLKGLHLWRAHLDRDAFLVARRHFEQALTLEPDFAAAHAFLGWLLTSGADIRIDPGVNPELEIARGHIEKALTLQPQLGIAHAAKAHYHLARREYDPALAAATRGTECDPTSVEALAQLAQVQVHCGQHEGAASSARRALRFGPASPPWYRLMLGMSLLMQGAAADALPWLRQVVAELCNSWRVRLWLIAAYGALECREAAQEEVQALLRLKPAFRFESWVQRAIAFRREEDMERMLRLLRRAGLEETARQGGG